MAKNEPRHVIAQEGPTRATLAKMSEVMHGHLVDTALRAGHGHAMSNVSGHTAPDNDHALQKNQFIPQRVLAGPSEGSQGSFQQGGAAADYETTSTGNTGDSDSGNPTGY